MSGFTHMNAHPDGPPTNPPLALADMIAGLHLALGVMIALRGARRGERGGQELDLSLYEPLFGFMAADFLAYGLTGEIPRPHGNETHYTAPRNSFRTRDGKWVALSASAQATFERLMDLVGRPDLRTAPGFRVNDERIRPESRAVLNGVIGDWIGARALAEVLSACEEAGVTIGPVYTMADVARDPHYAARGSIIPLLDPATNTVLAFPETPIRFSETPGKVRFPGLPMGAANQVILQDLLGHTLDEIAALRTSGAI